MVIKNVNLETVCGITSTLPENQHPEVAFSGKSNVGKSSLINGLMNRKAYARVSQQPGKTQTINYYNVNDEKWGKMIENYLRKSRQLRMVFLLVDIRHEPSANDKHMYSWIIENGFYPAIIATKLDKIKRSQIQKQLKLIREGLNVAEGTPIVPYSAVTKQGRDEIWELIETYAMAPEEELSEEH